MWRSIRCRPRSTPSKRRQRTSPAEVCGRFDSAATLSDEDRNTIIEIARQALSPFQPKPEAKANARWRVQAGRSAVRTADAMDKS